MQKATNKKKIKKCVLCIYFNLEVHQIEREARSEIAKTLNQRISRISADKVANKQMREHGSSATTIKVRERERERRRTRAGGTDGDAGAADRGRGGGHLSLDGLFCDARLLRGTYSNL